MTSTQLFTRLSVSAGVLALAIFATWTLANSSAGSRYARENLQTIESLLQENQRLVEALRAEGYTDSESALLESYLTRIRRDGVPRNSAMRQRIDTIVDNNTVILAFLSRYAPLTRTPELESAADRFRRYAISFQDRWQSLFEVFMAGGNLPAAGPEYPPDFAAAVSHESHSL
jgi:hypothetical protein